MSEVQEPAFLRFQRMYREDWGKFLESDMGRTLISALYSQRPQALPSDIPSKDSYVLGKIFEFDLMMQFLAVDLRRIPFTKPEPVKQDYQERDQNPKKES